MKYIAWLFLFALAGCASVKQANLDAREDSYAQEIERMIDKKTGDIKFRAVKLNTFTQSDIPGQAPKRNSQNIDVVFKIDQLAVIGQQPFSVSYSEIDSFTTEMTQEKVSTSDILLFGVFSAWMGSEISKEGWVILKRTKSDPVYFSLRKQNRELFVRVLAGKLSK